MIYLKNITAGQTIRVAVSGLGEGAETPTFVLRSTTDNREVYELAWQDGVAEVGYLRGTIRLPDGLSDGEYEYALSEGTQVLGRGVAQVGVYESVTAAPAVQETITFKQYERRQG